MNEAPSIRMRPRKLYEITLENAGGLNIKVHDVPAAPFPASNE